VTNDTELSADISRLPNVNAFEYFAVRLSWNSSSVNVELAAVYVQDIV
jgi:hypothetical protein